nr:unnamed protein product [Callosobruchus chinensis]
MEKYFWDENQLVTPYEKKIYHNKHRELMKKIQLFICLYMMTLMPEFIPYHWQLVLNNTCGGMNTFFTILPTDLLFLCLITLTEIQFQLTLLMYFGLILVNMCIEMYKTSVSADTKTVFQSVMYICSAMYEFTFCYCYPVQKLIDQAYQLGDCIYLSNWEGSQYSNKDVMLIIALSQKGIHIVAGGMTDINSATGLNTVKAMVSYTAFLKTVTTAD